MNTKILEKENEKAILVGCILPHQEEEKVESSLHELFLLSKTAQANVVSTVTQNRARIDSKYYIGKGKMEEIKELAEEDVDLVIFNDELTPKQIQNLENVLPCKVLDRTQLILDIFAMRAQSKEGKMQVELAQLQYLLPRIVGQGTSLSRLGGGIGTRGPGETKLEVDRRHIRKRMQDIKQQLRKIVSHRDRYRQRRKKNEVFQVTLVGYTNAGKSTLLNQLTNADSYTEDQLFATLDPTTKQLNLESGHVLLADTVGFIQELPTALIAAFRSTLEEVKEADLILHVIDSTDNDYPDHIEVVEQLIAELGAGHIPIIKIFNKKDRLPSEHLFPHEDDLYVSAYDQDDLEKIKERIEKIQKSMMIVEQLNIPAEQADLLAQLRKYGFIENLKWQDTKNEYDVRVYLHRHHPLGDQIGPLRT